MIADSPPEAAHDPLIPGRTHLSADVKDLEVSRLSLQMINMNKFKVAIIKFLWFKRASIWKKRNNNNFLSSYF